MTFTDEEIQIIRDVINVIKILKWMAGIGGISLLTVVGFLISNAIKLTILHKAIKSQMRSSLREQYKVLIAQDFINEADFNEFENQYKAYHKLQGENNVLDEGRKLLTAKFLAQDKKGETHEQ